MDFKTTEIGIVEMSLFVLIGALLVFSFVFDMKYIFPEINKVEKCAGHEFSPSEEVDVLGVNFKGVTIAYPLSTALIPRHIINDSIAGHSILLSYCAICRSALGFKAEISGEKLYFKVAGVWRRNMIVFDTLTHSLWQQSTGECIYGHYKGQTLELISGENTTWKAWFQEHPETQYAFKCVEARRAYVSREFMLKGLNTIPSHIMTPGFTDLKGLKIRETVFGVTYDNISRAYPLERLKAFKESESFEDRFNGKKIRLHFNSQSNYLHAFNEDKERIIVEKHWWLGWKEFHPNTEIWSEAKK